MNRLRAIGALATLVLTLIVAVRAAEADDEQGTSAAARGTLVFACEADNDLYASLIAGGDSPRRFDSPEEAIDFALPKSSVLMLAAGYPEKRTVISQELLDGAKRKELRLYIEYPAEIPGIKFGDPRGVRWERAVVASDAPSLGLPRLRILAMHDCQFLPTESDNPLLVLARVAGYDEAVFGLPDESHPVLFQLDDNTWIATTKLSDFVTARYAPSADWLTLWQHLLSLLDPDETPHKLTAKPLVQPAFAENDKLPPNAEGLALRNCANWYKNSRLLIAPDREANVLGLLRKGIEVTAPPAADAPVGDGSRGILEGYASQILPDGSQLQRTPIRADCQAETAAVLALHATLQNDSHSERVARNLTNYLYFASELHSLERGDPKHPAYGLISWGAGSSGWRIANYGDDNARTLLATMVVAGTLNSDEWDEAMLKALYANLRTTGRLGFRGDRIDMPELEKHGWKSYAEGEVVNISPAFEAYSWACFLWAYAHTGDRDFLEKTKIGIRRTMEVYPAGWRWGNNLDRSRMILALAWLVRVEDTAEHRSWLKTVADDLLKNQQPCGAIPEELSDATTGHFLAPSSNEAYGTSETPLLQEDGDPVSDQLYMTNFTLIGLREAVAATKDPALKAAEDKLAEYVVRIQVRSKAISYLDGTWFRAFDFQRWDYWSSSGDMGWGAWCAETGWGPAWNGITLGLRTKRTSLWDLTASSRIEERMEVVAKLMAENNGAPFAQKLSK